MLNNRRTCELAVHYNSSQHDISQMRFTVIEQVVSFQNPLHLDQLLLTREAYWMTQLFTFNPHGLNKRREFRSKNRINYHNLFDLFTCSCFVNDCDLSSFFCMHLSIVVRLACCVHGPHWSILLFFFIFYFIFYFILFFLRHCLRALLWDLVVAPIMINQTFRGLLREIRYVWIVA